jgi:aminoglycoside 6'-N-acetyltransferase
MSPARDLPEGSAVVVRRPADSGWEYAVRPDSTLPGGPRLSGESVFAGASRASADQTGIETEPWAVDLSGRWATWAVTVPRNRAVDVGEWLPASAVRRRLTTEAADAVVKVDRIPEVTVDFRPMTRDDLPTYVDWQHTPHARQWFHAGRMDLAEAERRYGPRIDGDVPIRMWVIRLGGRDVGMLQDYRVGDNDEYAAKTGDPDAAAFDYLIGDPDLVGRGIGTRMVGQFLRERLRPAYPDAPRFLASPDHRNRASLRLLDKLGFRQGLWIDEPAGGPYDPPETEIVCTLDVDRWYG